MDGLSTLEQSIFIWQKMHSIFGDRNPNKKFIVFFVTGALYCKDPTKKPYNTNVIYNYTARLGIVKLFFELLESKFAIDI